jgi:hypothetical protein
MPRAAAGLFCRLGRTLRVFFATCRHTRSALEADLVPPKAQMKAVKYSSVLR